MAFKETCPSPQSSVNTMKQLLPNRNVPPSLRQSRPSQKSINLYIPLRQQTVAPNHYNGRFTIVLLCGDVFYYECSEHCIFYLYLHLGCSNSPEKLLNEDHTILPLSELLFMG